MRAKGERDKREQAKSMREIVVSKLSYAMHERDTCERPELCMRSEVRDTRERAEA